jgi:hypothetical protein
VALGTCTEIFASTESSCWGNLLSPSDQEDSSLLGTGRDHMPVAELTSVVQEALTTRASVERDSLVAVPILIDTPGKNNASRSLSNNHPGLTKVEVAPGS